MKVKNIPFTQNATCNCKSWLEHWEKFSKRTATDCSIVNCDDPQLVGAHVEMVGFSKHFWYVIPLCEKCRDIQDEELEVKTDVIFVSANVFETCMK